MASYTERVLKTLHEIAARDRCSLFDATVTYCDEHDLEVEELVGWLDAAAIKTIKQSALDTNRVRKCVEIRADALTFE